MKAWMVFSDQRKALLWTTARTRKASIETFVNLHGYAEPTLDAWGQARRDGYTARQVEIKLLDAQQGKVPA